MGITGNLKTMVLAELLQWLSQGQKTGTLVIDSGTVEKKIYLRDGAIISSGSSAEREHLGNFLVAHGYLDEEKLALAVERQKQEGKMIGEVLVEMEAIAQDELDQMLRFKAEESIYEIFTWDQGDFEFLDGELPDEEMVPMNLDVQWIVLEGSRRMDELSRIREQVPSGHCVPVSVTDLEKVEVEDEDHRHVLSWVDDNRTVEEISEASNVTVFVVTQVLAEQVLAGHVKVVRPRIIEVKVDKKGEAAPAPIFAAQPMPMPVPMPYPQAYAPPMPQAGHPIPSLGQHPGFATPPVAPAAPSAPAAVATPPAPAPEPEPRNPAEAKLREAAGLLAEGKLDRALAAYRGAAEEDGADDQVRAQIAVGEENVAKALDRAGIKLSAVPRLSCDMTSLTQLEISPQEGFMLTRINGNYDIKSLLQMNPAPQLETRMLFWRLEKSGHVAF